MKILHVMFSHYSLPPEKYGGTERVVWYLAQEQEKAGHEVRYLWGKGKNLPANAIVGDKKKPVAEQIDDWPDIVHFHRPYDGELHKPYVSTEHGNASEPRSYSQNCIFLSKKHAENHGASCYVYNGLDWNDYGAPNLDNPGDYFHFLAKANAPSKNLKGTIKIAREAGVKLKVLGGDRINLKRKYPYFYLSPKVSFHGMVGGTEKLNLLKNSQGLLFPVQWHEPFGLALIESLYLGTPVFASPYGAIPEIVSEPEMGIVSDSYSDLIDGVKNIDSFSRKICHQIAKERFSSEKMFRGYQKCYEKVLSNEVLNPVRPETQGSGGILLPMK